MVAKINDLVDKKFFGGDDYFHLKQSEGLDKKVKTSVLNKASVKSFDNTESLFVSTNMQNAIEELSVLEIVSEDAYYQAEVTESKTVGPGGDFTSIYSALAYFANKLSTSSLDPRPFRNSTQTPYYLITLLSGWVLESGSRTFKNVDFSHIKIQGAHAATSQVRWFFINSKAPVMAVRAPSACVALGNFSELRAQQNTSGISGEITSIARCGSKVVLSDPLSSSSYGQHVVSLQDCSKLVCEGIVGTPSNLSLSSLTLANLSEAYLHTNPGLDVRSLSKVFLSGLKVPTGSFYARGLSEIYVQQDSLNTNIVGADVYADHGARIRIPNHARTGNGIVRSTFGSEIVLDSTLNQIRVIYNTQINNASKFRGEWKTASTSIAVLVASRASLVTLDVNTNNFVPNIAANTFTSSGLYIKETS